MSLTLEWYDIALRLALAFLAGGSIGINRTERSRPAGLRTNLLVCLASAVAMLLANALLSTTGKAPDSFVNVDVMRLPLGILTGMGFIGGGAILRRGDLVLGVTTAATLWMVTVIGLCFGGGQYALGLTGVGLTHVVLAGLQKLESWLPKDHRAILVLSMDADGPTEDEIRASLVRAGYQVQAWSVAYCAAGQAPDHKWRCTVRWRSRQKEVQPPDFLQHLMERPGVRALQWRHG
jgi:putative Mg2+ transporter-C (MgtC) family protein